MPSFTPFFTRQDINEAKIPVKLLHDGRLFNARVFQVEAEGQQWVLRDFAPRPFYVRALLRLVTRHEVKILKCLTGVRNVSQLAFQLDKNAVVLSYFPGESLLTADPKRITVEFLEKLEKLTRTLHEAGIVHLDIRGNKNVLITPEGDPAIIDFQSGLRTYWMPKWLRKTLEDIDLSGAYKKWLAFQPDAMGDGRRRELERINRIRRFWIFRGW